MEKDLLKRLLQHFNNFDEELLWPYREDYSLKDVDEDLNEDLLSYMEKTYLTRDPSRFNT